MEQINILYIDDDIDIDLVKYLKDGLPKNIGIKDVILRVDILEFSQKYTLKEFIQDEKVNESNILIIDSSLFKDSIQVEERFTGEEVRLIFAKYLPYIEVIVVTQNGAEKELGTLDKFYSEFGNENQFYDENLKPKIKTSIDKIISIRKIEKKLSVNHTLDELLRERIHDAISGIGEYDNLKKDDIDQIIELFNKMVNNENG